MKRLSALTLFMLLGFAGLVSAAEVDRKISADADGTVDIEMISGEIRVIGGSGTEVHVTGTINERYETLEIDGSGKRTSIEVEIDDDRGSRGPSADLTIRVPAGSDLSIETISSTVEIKDVRGEITVEVISGELTIEGDDLTVSAATVSGRIEILGGMLREADIETVSGSIRVEGELDRKGDFDFEIFSGDVTLLLPSSTSAEFDISTFSGTIDNDFGPGPTTSELLPSKSLSFSLGSGDASVSVESFQGNVRLKKQR